MSSGLFDLLPIELIEKILIFLSPQDLTSAACLNGSIHKIIKDSVDIQYALALGTYGMIDGDKSRSTSDKLTELMRMEEAWRTLDFSRRVSVKVPHYPSLVYDLSGGIYLLGDCDQTTSTRETKSLRFYDLTSCRNGPVMSEETWRRMSVPDLIVDVCLAIQEHDLVGIIGVRELEDGEAITLHLRQFSTGLPHPHADRPVIPVGLSEYLWRKLSIRMEIVGPFLMLLLSWPRSGIVSSKDILLLVNWWTGEIIIREEVLSRMYAGFVFLTPNLVLLPNSLARTFEILQLPDLTNIDNTSSTTFKRIARLGLPRMNANCSIFNITCRSDPNPVGVPHPNQEDIREWQRSRGRPFSADPLRALVLAHVCIRESELRQHPWLHWDESWHRLNLVVHRDALLEAIRVHLGPSAMNDGGKEERLNKVVPWLQWAQGIVRWFKDDEERPIRITTTSGQRFANSDTYRRLVVKDFNPHAIKRWHAAFQASGQWNRLQLNDSTCAELVRANERYVEDLQCLQTVFSTEDILTKQLPYVETVPDLSKMGIRTDSVLLDEERIIGLVQDSDINAVVEFDVISM